jgi:hypothetical protein
MIPHLDWEQIALGEGAVLVAVAAYRAGRAVEREHRRSQEKVEPS